MTSPADQAPDKRYLSTAQVAQALNVSVTTVKRWVDDGRISAHKTVGGHRKLLLDEVLRFIREGNVPHADLTALVPVPACVDFSCLTVVYQQLLAALLTADHTQVRAIIHGAYAHGYALLDLADQVVGPALIQIGYDWECGRLGVMHEHRATQALVATLYELLAALPVQTERKRPVAVGGAPEKDPTLVPTLLAKMVLLDAGWEAINLGPQTPLSAFHTAMTELKPQLVWLSVTHLTNPDEFVRDFNELARRATEEGIAVVIGGGGLTTELTARLHCSHFGKSMSELSAFARTLHCPTGAPRRGRPPREPQT